MKQNYYGILAESMTNKILKEAWSDSMPDWMKPRLNATAYFSDRNSGDKAIEKSKRSGVNLRQVQLNMGGGQSYDQADYQKPRGGSRGKSLFDAFKAANIDLNQVKFISGEPPTSKNDPRIQAPNIGIWNLPGTGQVYAMGLNDLEKLRSVSLAGETYSKYADYAFKYLPIKVLKELCNGQFCYIDGKDIPQRDIKDIQSQRLDYERWAMNNPTLVRGAADYWNPKDKSGYSVIPSSKRLARQLQALKAKNWSKWFEEAEDNLQELYSDITSAMASFSWKDASDVTSAVQNALNYYNYALNDYKRAMRRVQDLIDAYGEGSQEFLTQIGRDGYSSVKSYLEDTKQEIEHARMYVDKYVLKYIDF